MDGHNYTGRRRRLGAVINDVSWSRLSGRVPFKVNSERTNTAEIVLRPILLNGNSHYGQGISNRILSILEVDFVVSHQSRRCCWH